MIITLKFYGICNRIKFTVPISPAPILIEIRVGSSIARDEPMAYEAGECVCATKADEAGEGANTRFVSPFFSYTSRKWIQSESFCDSIVPLIDFLSNKIFRSSNIFVQLTVVEILVNSANTDAIGIKLCRRIVGYFYIFFCIGLAVLHLLILMCIYFGN